MRIRNQDGCRIVMKSSLTWQVSCCWRRYKSRRCRKSTIIRRETGEVHQSTNWNTRSISLGVRREDSKPALQHTLIPPQDYNPIICGGRSYNRPPIHQQSNGQTLRLIWQTYRTSNLRRYSEKNTRALQKWNIHPECHVQSPSQAISAMI